MSNVSEMAQMLTEMILVFDFGDSVIQKNSVFVVDEVSSVYKLIYPSNEVGTTTINYEIIL